MSGMRTKADDMLVMMERAERAEADAKLLHEAVSTLQANVLRARSECDTLRRALGTLRSVVSHQYQHLIDNTLKITRESV